MLSIICQKCNKEFKVSGADFDEHKSDGSLALCPACKAKKEKPVKIIPVESGDRKKKNGK